jgi:hypothetical protein
MTGAPCLLRADGTTTCCDAMTTYVEFTQVCKGCYGEVEGFAPTEKEDAHG